EHPGQNRSEERIDHSRRERRAKGQLIGSHGTRSGGHPPEFIPSHPGHFEHQGSQGKKDNRAQVKQGEPHREAEPRQHVVTFGHYRPAAQAINFRYSPKMACMEATSAATCRFIALSWGVSRIISNGVPASFGGAVSAPS